jgi:hypothetical protein
MKIEAMDNHKLRILGSVASWGSLLLVAAAVVIGAIAATRMWPPRVTGHPHQAVGRPPN